MFYGLLLSTASDVSNDTNTASIIIKIIIRVVIVAALFGIFIFAHRRHNVQNEVAKEELEKLFTNLESTIKKYIIEAIDKIDISNSKGSFLDFQADFFSKLYKDITEILYVELEKTCDPLVVALIKKMLTEEKIEEYVNNTLNNKDISSLITDIANKMNETHNKEIEEEDKKLQEEYDKLETEETDNEDSSIEKLDPSVVIDPENNYKEEINPPKEEESDEIKDDGSIEVIE